MSSTKGSAVGYARVSTERQATEGVSLDAQKERILAWAQANDYELLELFVDAGLSGSRADNRPGLRRAVNTACKRKAALVVYSLSRLARSTKDALMLAERLNKAGADLVSLTESIDTTSASGKMVYRMLSVLNEFQRELIAEHTAEALAFKARNGQRFSRFAPFGYRVSQEGDLVKNEREQETIRQVHELSRRGLSIRQRGTRFQRRVQSKRSTTFTKSSIQNSEDGRLEIDSACILGPECVKLEANDRTSKFNCTPSSNHRLTWTRTPGWTPRYRVASMTRSNTTSR